MAELNDHGYVEINPADAESSASATATWSRSRASTGRCAAEAHVSRESAPKRGVVFMPFHFADAPANRLTGTNLDPTAKIPGLKVTAVRVRKVDSA